MTVSFTTWNNHIQDLKWEIIKPNGGPRGCDEVVLPSNYKLPFVYVANVRFNPTRNRNLTLVKTNLTGLPLKTKVNLLNPSHQTKPKPTCFLKDNSSLI